MALKTFTDGRSLATAPFTMPTGTIDGSATATKANVTAAINHFTPGTFIIPQGGFIPQVGQLWPRSYSK